ERKIDLPAVSSFRAEAGFGLEATVEGHTVQLGAERYMRELGVDLGEGAELVARLAREAKTPVLAAVDGRLAGVLGVADPIKPSSRMAVRAMQALGIEVAMITGDSETTARAIGRELDISTVLAEQLPRDKAAKVKTLQDAGKKVAFIGDGINDAPAL